MVRPTRPALPNPEVAGAAFHMGAGAQAGAGTGTGTGAVGAAAALGAAVAALYTATLPPALPGGDAGNVSSAASPPGSGGGEARYPVGPGPGVTPPGRWHQRDFGPLGADASRSPLKGVGMTEPLGLVHHCHRIGWLTLYRARCVTVTPWGRSFRRTWLTAVTP